jgi:hypothetical protein
VALVMLFSGFCYGCMGFGWVGGVACRLSAAGRLAAVLGRATRVRGRGGAPPCYSWVSQGAIELFTIQLPPHMDDVFRAVVFWGCGAWILSYW